MLDLSKTRVHFPSLAQTENGQPVVFFDNPGGTQCPRSVIDAVAGYFGRDNSNHGGAFATSQRSDAMLADAHQAMADMLGAASADEIVFGANMTTLTLAMSRALARRLKPGDEVVVTRLDHDGNVAPWLLAARDSGASVRWVDVDPADCTLDPDSLRAAITPRTRIVAVGYASNAVGTVNDIKPIIDMAHDVGALAYIDAVQYAPHGPIDVRALGCDFLACSAYKFFGPHEGILYGRYDLLQSLEAYKVRPAPAGPPGKFETGTQNHEGIAGTLAAVEYLAGVAGIAPASAGRRQRIVAGLAAIKEYEKGLSSQLIQSLQQTPAREGVGHHRHTAARLARADRVVHNGGHAAQADCRVSGQARHLRLGRQLLRAVDHGATGPGGDRRHVARRACSLQHAGRDPPSG